MITQEEILNSEVRSLAMKQPYAQLMLEEKQETRTWNTKYRGLVLFTSSLRGYSWAEVEEMAGTHQTNEIIQLVTRDMVIRPSFVRDTFKPIDFLPLGQTICIGRLLGTISGNEYKTLESRAMFEKYTFVEWKPNLYVHLYREVLPVEQITWKGTQGFRTLTNEQKQLIKLKR